MDFINNLQEPEPELNRSGEVTLKRRSSELKEFKVLGTSGSIIIAIRQTDQQPVAIKVQYIFIYFKLIQYLYLGIFSGYLKLNSFSKVRYSFL